MEIEIRLKGSDGSTLLISGDGHKLMIDTIMLWVKADVLRIRGKFDAPKASASTPNDVYTQQLC